MDAASITKIGVVGAGLMGHGIALQFALRGYDVMLNDLDDERLDDALANVKINLGVLRGLGLASDEDEQSVPARIHTGTSLEESMAEVDFVVEAVFEDMPLKLSVFEALDNACPERTVLTSNTSSFMTSQLAPATKRPDRVLVANWWNPPYLLPLIEVVRGPRHVRRGAGNHHRHIRENRQAPGRSSEGVAGVHRQPAAVRPASRGALHRCCGHSQPRGRGRRGDQQLRAQARRCGAAGGVRPGGLGHHIAHNRPAIPGDRVRRANRRRSSRGWSSAASLA